MLFYNLICNIWQFFASINDKIFRYGCDFSKWEVPKELGSNFEKGNKYQPSTDKLRKVLKKFNITNNDSIIDIGCGKGKAMFLMSKYKFKKIYGIDLSQELVDIANRNFSILKINQCKAIKNDATTFKNYDEFNYFYIFNSFPEKIFIKVIENIQESIKRKPRKCIFIYLNPVCSDYLEKNTNFKEIYKFKSIISWLEYRCYEYSIK